MDKIKPYLWFDKGKAKEASKFYTDVFKEAKIIDSLELNGTPSGTVTEITIKLFGKEFVFLDIGPEFTFNEAISFVIDCEDQEEVDYYWNALTADGGAEVQCGWLKDKFGVSWQVVPKRFYDLMQMDKSGKLMEKMLEMKKLIIADLEKAVEK
jgi:predicted 3-demethylubiquinone-9 3-methyltransferase (glyoxalase superfamily)